MYQKKRIRTVVITGTGIKKAAAVLVFFCVLAAVFALACAVSKLPAPGAEYGKSMVSYRFHAGKLDLKSMCDKIWGFDFDDKKTILYRYHALYTAEAAPLSSESAVPESEPQQTASPQHNINEVNAARGMEISNLAGIAVDPQALLAEPLKIKPEGEGPQVLVIHTHTTESFTDAGKTKYSASDSDRSTDASRNVTAVGDVFCSVLEEKGIKTIHDTTVHDYPSFNGAYTRSMSTVKNNLQKYPSIKVVLDLHRDGIVRADGTKIKVAAEVCGEKSAQCMFVVGTNAKLTHDNWQENMRLACKLQDYANKNYPGLMRPIIMRKERFNQQVSKGALIIEIGSNGNTLDEAKTGAKYMAATLAEVLISG